MLDVDGIHVYYGLSHVLQGVSLNVMKGEIVSVLGRNGAGKTTLLRSITGLTPPKDGTIRLQERKISGMKPHEISKLGISYVPQGRGLFPTLSVWDNLKLAAMQRGIDFEDSYVFETFPILKERRSQYAGTLSGGEQQMLAIARGLISRPRLLLLDEPSEGIQITLIEKIAELIKGISKEHDLSVLLVEQNLELALATSERCYIIEKGQVARQGAVADIGVDELKKYLAV